MNKITPALKFNHLISFSLSGKKGQVLQVTQAPQVLFRGESMRATDDSVRGGHATRIISIHIGNRKQIQHYSTINAGKATHLLGPLSVDFSLGGFDTCQRDVPITVEVEFLEDCTWTATIKGAASGVEATSLRDLQRMSINAEMFALIYAGCEAQAFAINADSIFHGVVQGFTATGEIVLGTRGNHKRAGVERDIVWTVNHPVTEWYICKVDRAKVVSLQKRCTEKNKGTMCRRTLGHVGDHVSVTANYQLADRWPSVAPPRFCPYRHNTGGVEYLCGLPFGHPPGHNCRSRCTKRASDAAQCIGSNGHAGVCETSTGILFTPIRFCGARDKGAICQLLPGHEKGHVFGDACGGRVDNVLCTGPRGHKGICEFLSGDWNGDDKETTPITIDFSTVIKPGKLIDSLLRLLCGLPSKCLTAPQVRELRELGLLLHPVTDKPDLDLLRQNFHVVPPTITSVVAGLKGETVKPPSLDELKTRLLALAGDISHAFLSVGQSRELNEAMRKVRAYKTCEIKAQRETAAKLKEGMQQGIELLENAVFPLVERYLDQQPPITRKMLLEAGWLTHPSNSEYVWRGSELQLEKDLLSGRKAYLP